MGYRQSGSVVCLFDGPNIGAVRIEVAAPSTGAARLSTNRRSRRRTASTLRPMAARFSAIGGSTNPGVGDVDLPFAIGDGEMKARQHVIAEQQGGEIMPQEIPAFRQFYRRAGERHSADD